MQKIVFEKNISNVPYSMEEAINRLRVNVSFLGDKTRKIMITSTLSNEGKSLVSMQLWRQMAAVGNPSVLVDMDLRNSVMVEQNGILLQGGGKPNGTTQYLSGKLSLDEVIGTTDIEGADLIPNVDNVINPNVLLEGEKFPEMLDALSEKYRYVFLDVPPLDLVSDGEKIGSMCDGAILVIRGESTSRRLVRNSVQQLERAGCPILGIVLNRVSNTKQGYYRKYGKYYSDKEKHYHN